MKNKKINTIPNGRGIIAIMVFLFLLFFLTGLVLLPDIKGSMGLFAFSIFFLLGSIHFIANQHWNLIEVTSDGVCHKQERYRWEDVCITVTCRKPTFSRNAFEYYAFFDDHFLTDEETTSKVIKRKGFYLILNKKRLDLLLSNYPNMLRLLNENHYRGNAYITNQIQMHNESVRVRFG